MRRKSAVSAAALAAALLVLACANSPTPSPSEQAKPKPKRELFPGTALLVIDVQNGIFPVWRQEAVLETIKQLVAKAEKAGVPVIYIYQSDGSLIPGDRGWFMHDAIRPPEGHEQVRKQFPSAFTQTELEALLDVRRVGKLVACGLASEGCVTSTVLGAAARGYHVVLAADAHSTVKLKPEGTPESVNGNLRSWGVEVLPASDIRFE